MPGKLAVLLFSFILLVLSCNTTEPPPPEKMITLSLEDAASIEAWINLTTSNLQLPATLTLEQTATGGDQTRSTINLVKADTLIFIDSLLPNTTYTFQAITQSSNQPIISNELSIVTLDTTSHNFTWQTFTFGEHSNSVLRDVAIINENNIWTVGEIFLNDSLGQSDSKRYNAAVWNGQNWTIKRIPYYYQGQPFYHPIQSVFAFGPNDIWFCGNGIIQWDGNSFTPILIPTNVWGPYQMNKIWGSSSNDLYVAGNNGNIARYYGNQWSRIESGTELHIYDIWGKYNYANIDDEVLCVASNRFINGGNKILQIEGIVVKEVINEGLPWSLNSLWFIPERKYFIGGDGLYSTTSLNKKWSSISNLPNYYKTSIRGNALNDIIVAGSFGLLLHYNGFNWKDFQDITYINGSFTRLDINRNLVACDGGLNNGKAIVLIGKR